MSAETRLRVHQATLEITTRGRGTQDITREVQAVVRDSGIATGLCHVFLRHTSAGLVITENADPRVREDLERFMARIAPDGDPLWQHDDEGPDDMPAHVRSVVGDVALTVPVGDGRCALGTWQGVYLWEHRRHGHRREIVVTVQGIPRAESRRATEDAHG
ncbi:MAG: secondary thiamine-phosphate synthase enzyme YjbQ [Gammaproteobacteria bacterium]